MEYAIKYILKRRNYTSLLIQIMLGLIFSGCNFSTKDNSVRIENADLANATWIGAQEHFPAADSLLYGENPTPIFRKEFTVKKNIRSAILYITSAGYYHASLNGERIGENYLDPAWTNFEKRIYYAEYDLSDVLSQGKNCLGITLGNGFYNLLPMTFWGRRNIRNVVPTGNPVFIARLKLEYSDGQMEELTSNHSWKYAYGPIKKNNVYLGEVYDARDEVIGWETIGFDDSQWLAAVENDGPGGMLHATFFPPIQHTDSKIPISITSVKNGNYVVDMGVNFTGNYRIHLKGEPGDTITFRFGERIYDNGELNPMTTVAGQIKHADGGPGAPAIAWQTDSYIFGNKTDVWYRPEFTFHTYRYMEIAGLDEKPKIADIDGISLHTNVEHNSSFSSSSELINSIQNATERTFLANLISVQSDCPAREKFGYGGDLNATCEAFIYNYDMQDFYRKTIYDWVDAMNDSVFIDTAPFVGIQYCGISWESAFLTTQYSLFLYYNDTAIIKELYQMDLEWMEKAARIHPNGIVEAGLSDHESLVPVPVELTGTGHYLQCARIMKKFASYMGDIEHERQFEILANKLSKIMLDKFWRAPIANPISKQTLFSTLLYHNIIPEKEIDMAVDSLLASLSTEQSGHFNTGIFGTKYMLETLSKTGNTKAVYDIVVSTTYPGWGHMIDRGATTLWETWKESDNTYSNCHPMFGSVSEWFYRWLGGIRPNPDYPGFEKFMINPSLPEGLSHVSVSYNSPKGEIVSNWRNDGFNKQVFEITIPEGSMATVKLPMSEQQKITFLENSSGHSFTPNRNEKNHGTLELPSGKYVISVHL